MANDDIEVELDVAAEDESLATTQSKSKSKKGASAKPVARKIRLTVVEDDGGPLSQMLDTLKERGLKNYDLSEVVAEALQTIPESFWKAKLDDLTPLEWKIQAALDNPEMREKLVSLLDG